MTGRILLQPVVCELRKRCSPDLPIDPCRDRRHTLLKESFRISLSRTRCLPLLLATDPVNDMVSPADMIEDYLVDPETGEGLLLNAFSKDIKKDGCTPVQEVLDCTGAACTIAAKPDMSARQSTSLLLYALPVVAMGGLILWRRRR